MRSKGAGAEHRRHGVAHPNITALVASMRPLPIPAEVHSSLGKPARSPIGEGLRHWQAVIWPAAGQ